MKPHQQRVIDEKVQLDEKRQKLVIFQESEDFFVLCDEDERIYLIDQLNAMDEYSKILGKRIAKF